MVAFTLLLAACTNPATVLPSKTGEWNYTNKVTTTIGSSTSTSNESGKMVFNDNGTGTQTPSGGSKMDFDWSYNSSDKKITLTSGSNTIVYEITEAKSKSEKWYSESTSTILGITTTVKSEVSLSR